MALGSLALIVAGRGQVSAQTATAPQAIQEEAFVRIGGIDQWIAIHGQNAENPVLLLLHGGPGFPNAPFTPAFLSWQKDFTLVDWDQRGAGRTFGRNGAEGSGPLSIERLTQDGLELAQYLRARLRKDKVVVLALSFGSVVGLKMVHARPELFAAYVGTGQFVSAAEGDVLGYQLTLAAARAAANTEAVQALEALGPPPWRDVKARSAAKGWATRLTRADDPAIKMNVREMLKALPDYSDADRENLWKGLAFSTEPLVRDALSFDARALGRRFPVPLFVFQGADDLNTPTPLVKLWFGELEAPVKDIVVVEQASHGAFYTHSEQLGRFLAERVRPLALRE